MRNGFCSLMSDPLVFFSLHCSRSVYFCNTTLFNRSPGFCLFSAHAPSTGKRSRRGLACTSCPSPSVRCGRPDRLETDRMEWCAWCQPTIPRRSLTICQPPSGIRYTPPEKPSHRRVPLQQALRIRERPLCDDSPDPSATGGLARFKGSERLMGTAPVTFIKKPV
jgi:hypothetical protein